MRTKPAKTLAGAAAVLAIAALLGLASSVSRAATSGHASNATDSSNPGAISITFPAKLVAAAKKEALRDAGGKKIGGSVTVLSVNGGSEAQIVAATYKPFTDATGIKVNYTGSQNMNAIVQSRVQAGNPPDVVDSADTGTLQLYGKEGKLVDLGPIIGTRTLKADFGAGLLKAATVNGKVYGVWSEIDNFMVWYDPQNYTGPSNPATWAQLDAFAQQQAAAGKTPWCMTQNAGAASGFPGSQWIEAWFVKNYGPALMSAWGHGQLSWTSPQVKAAFQAFGAIATDPKMVNGGPNAVLSTSIVNNGTGLISTPPQCSLMLWGIYAGGLTLSQNTKLKPITDLNFFEVPAAKPAYANDEPFGGHVAVAFNNTPQVRAFLKYLASVAAQSLLVSSNQWTEANQRIPLSVYKNPLLRKAKQTLLVGKTLVAGPNMAASSATAVAFDKAVVSYIQNPGSLDSILAGVQKTVSPH
jgi:alpha-glucoside transport system substrate-binding protein